LNKLLRDDLGRLRNGWWILLFILVFLASQLVYRPVSHALKAAGASITMLSPLPAIFLLLVTWACLRLRRQPLSAVGLQLDARWVRQAAAGIAVGGTMMLAVAGLLTLAGGVSFGLDPARGLGALAQGAWFFVGAALLEELLFRGFVFQRLVDGAGVPVAQGLMAVLFVLAHWGNPGMDGNTEVLASIDTALGALLLGFAYLRTGSLALPIGLHFGWNWVQGSVLGFDVSGLDQAGWLLPHVLDKPQWFTGGAFGPEASVFSVIVDTAALWLMWRWKGVAMPAGRQARWPPVATIAEPPTSP